MCVHLYVSVRIYHLHLCVCSLHFAIVFCSFIIVADRKRNDTLQLQLLYILLSLWQIEKGTTHYSCNYIIFYYHCGREKKERNITFAFVF